MKVFIEYGIDIDNNKYIIGKNIEIEKSKTEYRTTKNIKIKKINGFYIRIWLFKHVFIFSTYSPIFKKQLKKRNNLKIVFGISGEK